MAKELIYRLSNPGYTIYHRAALGGLAATIRAWGSNPPEGITAELYQDRVRLAWSDQLSDQEALRRILAASFKLTDDKMIDLPGSGIRTGQEDLRLAIHNGILGTFLQHHKMRPGEKEPRHFVLRTVDDESGAFLTYKAVDSYAHQVAQGTGLLDVKLNGKWPEVATIPQSVIPGAMAGAVPLKASAQEVVLLLFLMVGCSFFLLRPRTYKEKAQTCIVVPDIVDLSAFARAVHRIASAGQNLVRLSNTYNRRVVGGVEEAALRFIVDLGAEDIASERCIAGCLAVAMGKVAWDPNQINRSLIVKLKGDYPELGVFRAAYQYFGDAKMIKLRSGESYAIPACPVPEIIAANLAAERHWCTDFKDLVDEKQEFNQLIFMKGGLKAMSEAVRDEDDRAIIHAFQAAWRMTMGKLRGRAEREQLDFNRLVEVERERMRNTILRAKTADALAGWFLRFCADATNGAALPALRDNSTRLRRFMFNQRNFDRFHNLCLFALVSYSSNENGSVNGGDN